MGRPLWHGCVCDGRATTHIPSVAHVHKRVLYLDDRTHQEMSEGPADPVLVARIRKEGAHVLFEIEFITNRH